MKKTIQSQRMHWPLRISHHWNWNTICQAVCLTLFTQVLTSFQGKGQLNCYFHSSRICMRSSCFPPPPSRPHSKCSYPAPRKSCETGHPPSSQHPLAWLVKLVYTAHQGYHAGANLLAILISGVLQQSTITFACPCSLSQPPSTGLITFGEELKK